MNVVGERGRVSWRAGVLVAVAAAAFFVLGAPPAFAATAYYVDCSAGTNGSGTVGSPWNNLTTVDNHAAFVGGDSILLKRGTTCTGALWPKGSGTSTSSFITLGDYSTGALPIVDASGSTTGIQLYNQQYWHIQNLEVKNSTRFGINIAGNNSLGALNHFRLTNLIVHHVYGSVGVGQSGYSNFWLSGLVIITDNPVPAPSTDYAPNGNGQAFNDVVIDNVQAYDTNQWHGIRVGAHDNASNITDSNGVTIENSTVHDVRGDGIVMSYTTNGLEHSNVAYNTGMAYLYGSAASSQDVWTPNGIWSWMCHTCTTEWNESYDSHSYVPGYDGGSFDIDWGSSNSVVQYNYGHDAETYCVAFFAFGNQSPAPDVSGTIRYNVCSNDQRISRVNDWAGEFTVYNTNRTGTVSIYNNTSSWDPTSGDSPVLYVQRSSGAPALNVTYKNNIEYMTGSVAKYPAEIAGSPTMSMSNNDYWDTGFAATNVWWQWNGTWYGGLSAFQTGTGQDGSSIYADPLLGSATAHPTGWPTGSFSLQSGSPAIDAGTNVGSMGSSDFYGTSIPQCGVYDIGAAESTSCGGGGGGGNVVINPGFENGDSGWSEWEPSGYTDTHAVNSNGPHTGSLKLDHWCTCAIKQFTYQDITGLTNKTYTLSVWVRSSGGHNEVKLGAKNYGGADIWTSIPTSAISSYTQYTLSVPVTNGQAEIYLWTDSPANASFGNWTTWDDVSFQ